MNILTREEFKKKIEALSKGGTTKPNNWISPVDVFAIEAGNSQGSANSGEPSMSVSESRKEILDADRAVNWIKTNCNIDEILNGVELWRGRESEEKLILIDPKGEEKRVSSNTVNVVNMIMSEDPLWKEYPSRDQSLIMINSESETWLYGSSYRVFPHKKSIFGICPDNDLFSSFGKYDLRPSLVSSILIWLTKTLDIPNIELLYSTNYADVKLKLKDIEIVLQQLDFDNEVGPFCKYIKARLDIGNSLMHRTLKTIVYKVVSGSTFESELIKLMNPKENGFTLVDFLGLPKMGDSREIWTDSPCLLVRHNILKSVIEQLTK